MFYQSYTVFCRAYDYSLLLIVVINVRPQGIFGTRKRLEEQGA